MAKVWLTIESKDNEQYQLTALASVGDKQYSVVGIEPQSTMMGLAHYLAEQLEEALAPKEEKDA